MEGFSARGRTFDVLPSDTKAVSPTGPSSRPRSPRTRAEPAEARTASASARGPRGGAEVARGASKDGRECVSARPNAKRGAGRDADAAGRKPAARRAERAARQRARHGLDTGKPVATKCGPGRNLRSRFQFFSRNGRRCLFPLAAACAPYRVARAPDAYRGGFSREGERIDTREAQEPRGALERRGRRLRSSLVVATECL